MTIVYAVLILGVIAVIFGLVLAFAAKVFEVEVDPRLPQIQSALAGANCGGCGYPGCAGCAEAILNGNYDAIVCDSRLRVALPRTQDFNIIDFPHFAVSGRLLDEVQ